MKDPLKCKKSVLMFHLSHQSLCQNETPTTVQYYTGLVHRWRRYIDIVELICITAGMRIGN